MLESHEKPQKIPVEHCTASGGNGHFIIYGEHVDFNSLNPHISKMADRSLGPVKPTPVIIRNWSSKNPCSFCRDNLEYQNRE